MAHAFAQIAFTPAVKQAQQLDGSRAAYARAFEHDGGPLDHHRLGADEAEFIARQRSFVLATVSETGWPYVQHRGGPAGFVKLLDERTLAWADFAGNRQLVSVGNASGNDRVALLMIDHARRERLKLLGRLEVAPLAPGDALWDRLVDPAYPARVRRSLVVHVEAFDWNCPQHIPRLVEVGTDR
jgi:predicted pyridoxine 5'-phosphate oxidase superfamily flavin-nucleotide-binding protein